ncbi:ABC transporter permease [Confluentibacter sediminis]|uniref:ABC transporter permease n=1 Tax=Confluentibacter sediminis TaxID=2219045 RepID=UPI000DAF0D6A|nr:ABC transporter permease [Confluentibacter sediminis]
MYRLLNIELYKLKHSRSSKMLIITYFVLLTSIALIASIKFDIGPVKFHLAEMGIFNFPYIWHFNSYFAAIFKLFLAIVIVSMMSNEYSNKTLKQNLIDGLSKKEFILSKFYTVIVLSVVSTLFLFVVSLILGLIFSSYTELNIIFSDLEYLLAFFVKLVGFFSFCLFLGVLVKRSAFALGFLFVWQFLEGVIFGVLKWYTNAETKAFVMQLLPLNAMSNLIKQPFSRLSAVQTVANQVGENFNFDYAVHWYEILIVIGWTALFIFLSYLLLKKRDL